MKLFGYSSETLYMYSHM